MKRTTTMLALATALILIPTPAAGQAEARDPSVAATEWPIDTNVSAGFAERDSRWPNYFLLEPDLHYGVRF